MRRTEEGFTLIEMMMVLSIAAILVTLGAMALRSYWLTHSLYGARDEAITQLRAQQEKVVSESHPLVFGARFRPGSTDWALIEYDPTTSQCYETRSMRFDTGVEVQAVSFSEAGSMAPIVSECRSDLSSPSGDGFAMFFARGTASEGSLTLEQPSLGKTLSLTVKPITGRIEETP